MADQGKFFDSPVLNSPYKCPEHHWELDEKGQPTGVIRHQRRPCSFLAPIPTAKGSRRRQQELILAKEGSKIADKGQQYDLLQVINSVRSKVKRWRELPGAQWRVTPETARLLRHWRHHNFSHYRPFFCQVEAVETVIWLTEVAPKLGQVGQTFLQHLEAVNGQANPDLARLSLKLATGAGKTTVMAMVIAWQTVNAVRHPRDRRFTRGFLLVTPGITVKDRLRVLQPNDPDSYYHSRELVPPEMLSDLGRAKIVITNFHAFKRRDTMEISKVGRQLLYGHGPRFTSLESPGQMLQRVMPELMGMKTILAINDEAHHCYQEKEAGEEAKLKGDDLEEAKKSREAARLWIEGLKAVAKLARLRVIDLSATPFFLRGSGYAEGTLFPWTVGDFSLMDAIECGIVKLPRVPVADNIPGGDMPTFRNLWDNIRKDMPKKGRGKQKGALDPLQLPITLQTALAALYGHYEKTAKQWQDANIRVPPCFIVVCNNTSTSKLVYDYIAGFHCQNSDGSTKLENGRLKLFRNFDENDCPYPHPPTLLVDSEQLESGQVLDEKFRTMAAEQIACFRQEQIQRHGHGHANNHLSDQSLLREMLNTVGKAGKLGEKVRCVVSVSMLTEGWDANTVTHILGVRAFGTQLLCEQVVGRALRRQSYVLNDDGHFPVEYADVLGIPFDFTAKPIVAPAQSPLKVVQVKAVSPQRDNCAIRFPRVVGYRPRLPEERLQATFNQDSTLELTPELIGPSKTRNEGIIGEGVTLNLDHTEKQRRNTVVFHLTKRLLETKWRNEDGAPKLYLFGQLKQITSEWFDNHLICKGGTTVAQLMVPQLQDLACERITRAIVAHHDAQPVEVILDPYNPHGSTVHVGFTTAKQSLWPTAPHRCHVNWVVCDSDWEAELCRVAEEHPRVLAYVKNHGLGLQVPYLYAGQPHTYIPDFILLVDDGQGPNNPLHLIIEIKGYRRENAKDKKATMETYWIPGVNALTSFGRWAFGELTDLYDIETGLDRLI